MSTVGKRHQLKERNSLHFSPFWKYPTVIKRSNNSYLRKHRTKHIQTHMKLSSIQANTWRGCPPAYISSFISRSANSVNDVSCSEQPRPNCIRRTAHQSNGPDGTTKKNRSEKSKENRRNCYMFWETTDIFSVYRPARGGENQEISMTNHWRHRERSYKNRFTIKVEQSRKQLTKIETTNGNK